MNFQLSKELDKHQAFIVKSTEIDERLDPDFYRPFRCKSNFKFPLKRIGNLSYLLRHPPEYQRLYADSGVQLIRSQNVRSPGLDLLNSPVFLHPDLLSIRDVYPEIGDVLIVRSGVNAGDTACVTEKIPNCIVGADTLLVRFDNKIIPEFVQYFFNLPIGSEIMSKYLTGATNKHISPYYLGKLQIPVPPLEVQDGIVKRMDAAYTAKKSKEAEAQRLLNSIDDYLLSELGIELPEQEENTIQSRIFTRRLSEVSGGRFDSNFYKPYYTSITDTIKAISHNRLGHIVKFSSESWD